MQTDFTQTADKNQTGFGDEGKRYKIQDKRKKTNDKRNMKKRPEGKFERKPNKTARVIYSHQENA